MCPDFELLKIRSPDKRQEILNIIHSRHPDHYSRLWFTGFLKHVGYDAAEICAIIAAETAWEDYDERATWLHVQSVFKTTKAFLNSFEGMPKGRGTFSKVPQDRIIPNAPVVCVVGSTTVNCHFHKCDICPVRAIGAGHG